jgi:hypothetical protein
MPDIDEKTLRIMRSYAGDVFTPKIIIREAFVEYSIDTKLPEFLQALREAVDTIPEEHKADARVELNSEAGFRIVYRSPESASELQTRHDNALRYATAEEQRERQKYERLKKKFE